MCSGTNFRMVIINKQLQESYKNGGDLGINYSVDLTSKGILKLGLGTLKHEVPNTHAQYMIK